MWCASCQSDVAAEVSADARRMRCAVCGNELPTASPPAHDERTRHALELLERWSTSRLLDPVESQAGTRTERKPTAETPPPDPTPRESQPASQPVSAARKSQSPRPAGKLRPKAAAKPAETSIAFPAKRSKEAEPMRDDPRSVQRMVRIDGAHASPWEPKHTRSTDGKQDSGRTNWLALAGQLLAYGGVAILTIGTTLVLWGHFGRHPEYTPTGWLVGTAGQMLLFLGVVTLVSSGIEQSNDDAARRIENLGLRVEQLVDAVAALEDRLISSVDEAEVADEEPDDQRAAA